MVKFKLLTTLIVLTGYATTKAAKRATETKSLLLNNKERIFSTLDNGAQERLLLLLELFEESHKLYAQILKLNNKENQDWEIKKQVWSVLLETAEEYYTNSLTTITPEKDDNKIAKTINFLNCLKKVTPPISDSTNFFLKKKHDTSELEIVLSGIAFDAQKTFLARYMHTQCKQDKASPEALRLFFIHCSATYGLNFEKTWEKISLNGAETSATQNDKTFIQEGFNNLMQAVNFEYKQFCTLQETYIQKIKSF